MEISKSVLAPQEWLRAPGCPQQPLGQESLPAFSTIMTSPDIRPLEALALQNTLLEGFIT
jgi:hypothetical protein